MDMKVLVFRINSGSGAKSVISTQEPLNEHFLVLALELQGLRFK